MHAHAHKHTHKQGRTIANDLGSPDTWIFYRAAMRGLFNLLEPSGNFTYYLV
jgi:hypothetical protein